MTKEPEPNNGLSAKAAAAFKAFKAVWSTPGIRFDHETFLRAWEAAAQAAVDTEEAP